MRAVTEKKAEASAYARQRSKAQPGLLIMPSSRNKRAVGRSSSTGATVTVDGTDCKSPTIAVFSGDSAVVDLVQEVCPHAWQVESCEDPECGHDLLSRPDVRLVLIDDEKIDEQLRGWLLDRVRRFAPQALLFYVAASHSEADEKRARSYQAHYYTSKPLDPGRTLRVLESFLQAASSRDGMGGRSPNGDKRR